MVTDSFFQRYERAFRFWYGKNPLFRRQKASRAYRAVTN
jgi:hypothetical protein